MLLLLKASSGKDLFVWMAEFLSEETALRVLLRNGPVLSRSCSSIAAVCWSHSAGSNDSRCFSTTPKEKYWVFGFPPQEKSHKGAFLFSWFRNAIW